MKHAYILILFYFMAGFPNFGIARQERWSELRRTGQHNDLRQLVIRESEHIILDESSGTMDTLIVLGRLSLAPSASSPHIHLRAARIILLGGRLDVLPGTLTVPNHFITISLGTENQEPEQSTVHLVNQSQLPPQFDDGGATYRYLAPDSEYVEVPSGTLLALGDLRLEAGEDEPAFSSVVAAEQARRKIYVRHVLPSLHRSGTLLAAGLHRNLSAGSKAVQTLRESSGFYATQHNYRKRNTLVLHTANATAARDLQMATDVWQVLPEDGAVLEIRWSNASSRDYAPCQVGQHVPTAGHRCSSSLPTALGGHSYRHAVLNCTNVTSTNWGAAAGDSSVQRAIARCMQWEQITTRDTPPPQFYRLHEDPRPPLSLSVVGLAPHVLAGLLATPRTLQQHAVGADIDGIATVFTGPESMGPSTQMSRDRVRGTGVLSFGYTAATLANDADTQELMEAMGSLMVGKRTFPPLESPRYSHNHARPTSSEYLEDWDTQSAAVAGGGLQIGWKVAPISKQVRVQAAPGTDASIIAGQWIDSAVYRRSDSATAIAPPFARRSRFYSGTLTLKNVDLTGMQRSSRNKTCVNRHEMSPLVGSRTTLSGIVEGPISSIGQSQPQLESYVTSAMDPVLAYRRAAELWNLNASMPWTTRVSTNDSRWIGSRLLSAHLRSHCIAVGVVSAAHPVDAYSSRFRRLELLRQTSMDQTASIELLLESEYVSDPSAQSQQAPDVAVLDRPPPRHLSPAAAMGLVKDMHLLASQRRPRVISLPFDPSDYSSMEAMQEWVLAGGLSTSLWWLSYGEPWSGSVLNAQQRENDADALRVFREAGGRLPDEDAITWTWHGAAPAAIRNCVLSSADSGAIAVGVVGSTGVDISRNVLVRGIPVAYSPDSSTVIRTVPAVSIASSVRSRVAGNIFLEQIAAADPFATAGSSASSAGTLFVGQLEVAMYGNVFIGASVGAVTSGGLKCFEPSPRLAGVDTTAEGIRYWRLRGTAQQYTGGGGHPAGAWIAADSLNGAQSLSKPQEFLGCSIGIVMGAADTTRTCSRQSDLLSVGSIEQGAIGAGSQGLQWTRHVSIFDSVAVSNYVRGPGVASGLYDISQDVRLHDYLLVGNAAWAHEASGGLHLLTATTSGGVIDVEQPWLGTRRLPTLQILVPNSTPPAPPFLVESPTTTNSTALPWGSVIMEAGISTDLPRRYPMGEFDALSNLRGGPTIELTQYVPSQLPARTSRRFASLTRGGGQSGNQTQGIRKEAVSGVVFLMQEPSGVNASDALLRRFLSFSSPGHRRLSATAIWDATLLNIASEMECQNQQQALESVKWRLGGEVSTQSDVDPAIQSALVQNASFACAALRASVLGDVLQSNPTGLTLMDGVFADTSNDTAMYAPGEASLARGSNLLLVHAFEGTAPATVNLNNLLVAAPTYSASYREGIFAVAPVASVDDTQVTVMAREGSLPGAVRVSTVGHNGERETLERDGYRTVSQSAFVKAISLSVETPSITSSTPFYGTIELGLPMDGGRATIFENRGQSGWTRWDDQWEQAISYACTSQVEEQCSGFISAAVALAHFWRLEANYAGSNNSTVLPLHLVWAQYLRNRGESIEQLVEALSFVMTQEDNAASLGVRLVNALRELGQPVNMEAISDVDQAELWVEQAAFPSQDGPIAAPLVLHPGTDRPLNVLVVSLPALILDMELNLGSSSREVLRIAKDAVQTTMGLGSAVVQIESASPAITNATCLQSQIQTTSCGTDGPGCGVRRVLSCLPRWKLRLRVGLPSNGLDPDVVGRMFESAGARNPHVQDSRGSTAPELRMAVHVPHPDVPVVPAAAEARRQFFCGREQNFSDFAAFAQAFESQAWHPLHGLRDQIEAKSGARVISLAVHAPPPIAHRSTTRNCTGTAADRPLSLEPRVASRIVVLGVRPGQFPGTYNDGTDDGAQARRDALKGGRHPRAGTIRVQVQDARGRPLQLPLLPVVVSVEVSDEPADRRTSVVQLPGLPRRSPVVEGVLESELQVGANGTVEFDLAVARAFAGARVQLTFRVQGSSIAVTTMPFTVVTEGFGPDGLMSVSFDDSRPQLWWVSPAILFCTLGVAVGLSVATMHYTAEVVSTAVVGRGDGGLGEQGRTLGDESDGGAADGATRCLCLPLALNDASREASSEQGDQTTKVEWLEIDSDAE